MTAENHKQRLRRFELVFVRSPIYFVTACTEARQKFLSNGAVHETFLHFAQQGPAHGAWVGAYVIMPDHFHLFVATDNEKITLSEWMKSLKNVISKTLRLSGMDAPHWQKTFFDHLLRSTESYSEKWNYVRENPVRAGLVKKADEWPIYGRGLSAGISLGWVCAWRPQPAATQQTMKAAKIVLGTRGSELARAQTRLVEKAIQSAHPGVTIETKVIATKGDKARVVDARAGRKGLFTAEIERALLAGKVDVAIHSAKDLPSETSPDAEIAAVLPRALTDDVLVSKHAGGLVSLPHGATVATGSVRRKHQLHSKRADLELIDLRGNVPTRLRKLAENEWDAIVLARAGLERLGLSPTRPQISFEGRQFFLQILPLEIFLPAAGQGIIALQVRADDRSTKAIVDLVNNRETLLCLQAEREFLRLLQGDCNCPVGVLAMIDNGKMKMRAHVFSGVSPAPRKAEVEGAADEGEKLAGELLRRIEQE